jgi:hypothetical protein
MTAQPSRGKILSDKLYLHLNALTTGACDARDRPIIWGVTGRGQLVGGLTLPVFLAQARHIVSKSGHLYSYGDSIVYEARPAGDPHLRTLAARGVAQPSATAVLGNLFAVGVRGDDSSTQSLLPAGLAHALLADDDLPGALPVIRHHARRPVFDPDFTVCGPGWHPESGILVHGPDVEPAVLPPVPAAKAATDRLPPYLKELLREFPWRSDADLANAVGFLLTGVLANHFLDDPHPVALIEGNQRGLGKTLLAQAVGRVLDGAEPPRIPLVGDEEVEKKLCARLLNDSRSSIFFFDNVRNRLESALLEQSVLSPVLEFRILGKSVAVSRPNNYLWIITSNLTSATEDFVSRGVPIRLQYEGDPKRRVFVGRPAHWASAHRPEILGELMGMVLRWRQQGLPMGQRPHRCDHWARIIGGILAANGLGDFLSNLEEAEAEMDEGLQALSTLAESVVNRGRAAFFNAQGPAASATGKPPRDWAMLFADADLYPDRLAGRSDRAKAMWVGHFLSSKVNRPVDITTSKGTGTATLKVREVRSRQKAYCFEIAVSHDEGVEPQPGSAAQDVNADTTTPPALPAPPDAASSGAARGAEAAPALAPGATPPEDGVRPAAAGTLPVNEPGNDLEWT